MNRKDLIIAGKALLTVVIILGLWSLFSFSTFKLFFAWPNGGVWGNIVAEFFLGLGALIALFRKLDKHHQEKMDQSHHHHLEIKKLLEGSHDGE